MEKIYNSPFRVYLCFALLLLVGVVCYTRMPVALFPNSTKPKIYTFVPYGNMTREAFIHSSGWSLESSFKGISIPSCTIDEVRGHYEDDKVRYRLSFNWEDSGEACLREVKNILASFSARLEDSLRERVHAFIDTEGTGFLFASFHSEKRSPEEIFEILEPLLQPKLGAIREASNPVLFNPSQKDVTIELLPLKMAAFRLLPRDVFNKIREQLGSLRSGVLREAGNSISLEVNSNIASLNDLEGILIARDEDRQVYLGQIASIKFAPTQHNSQVMAINGEPSVGLWMVPTPGKNIKEMSEKTYKAVQETLAMDGVPKDIKFSVDVNPAEFVDSSVANVLKEVWICSFIAVLVLFIFIGSFFATLTALIEIPTSIVLSFILMKLTGVQLNLVSLGGLALSVGMNVDASIVVIDSIIKRFKLLQHEKMSPTKIAHVVAEAVREVYVPVIVSTITSLIVFIPLVFTSDLTNAILGDLAKAVIYSHGLSLFIALFLVPTVRVQMASKFDSFAEDHAIGWLDRFLERSYQAYANSLQVFLETKRLRWGVYGFLVVLTAVVALFVPERLPREIIGKPDTPIVAVDVDAFKISHRDDMVALVRQYEQRINETFGEKIDFIYSNVWNVNRAFMTVHLKNKGEFKSVLEDMQAMSKNDPDTRYNCFPFNPAELPIPTPYDWKVSVQGASIADRQRVLDYFRDTLLEAEIVDDVKEESGGVFNNRLRLVPFEEKWNLLKASKTNIGYQDLSELITLATESVNIGKLSINNRPFNVVAKFPDQHIASKDALTSLPVPLGTQIVPLRALADIEMSKASPELLRVDGQDTFQMGGNLTEKEKKNEREILQKFDALVRDFKENVLPKIAKGVSLEIVDAKVELSKALNELFLTISLSIALIFLVLLIQFSSIVHALIVMLAIPFGILGVFISLYVFNSTLSLNSALGIILLVGITVANSIMLVEMILRLVHTGVPLERAIIETGKKRIRPIVMTSLVTILGMLPIAIGFGDGGKVLQPLGISVCGGLWVSLVFTLYVIPALEFAYLKHRLAHDRGGVEGRERPLRPLSYEKDH